MGIDLSEEDLYDMHASVALDYKISNEDLCISQNVPIVVSYDLVDLDKTPYHFLLEFTLRDTQSYFCLMQNISASTINDFLNNRERKLHFFRTDIRGI